jgi:nucleoside-diphosphate-sugar epimerase
MKQTQEFSDRVILVTGGCGFVGSHLVRRLVGLDVREVRVVDSLEMGSLANLEGCDGRVTHHPLRLGTVDRDALMPLLADVDVVFHLAAEKHNQALNRPEDLLRANVMGTHDLLECAARQGVGAVVFSSSLYAYGRLAGPPMREDEVPAPRTLYGISKLAGEHMVHALGQRTGIPTVCLRYFFVYGPRQYAGMGYRSVIVKNFERILSGRRPVITCLSTTWSTPHWRAWPEESPAGRTTSAPARARRSTSWRR